MIGLRAGKAGVVGGSPFQRFNPALLSPVAWYRYNTGITSAGGTVSAWANQTGGEALVQATAANQPVNGTPGANLAVNGTFDSDTDWTNGSGWTIGSGVATHAATGTNDYITQALSGGSAGAVYLITWSLTRTAGAFTSSVQGSTIVNGPSRNASGTYTDVLVAPAGSSFIWGIQANTVGAGSIDNVSIQKITADGTIYFDGISHFLKTAPFTLNQPSSTYFLGRAVTWSANDRIFDGNASNSGGVLQVTSTPRIQLNAGSGVANNDNYTLGAYVPMVAVFNGANSLLKVGDTAAVTGNAGAGNMGGITLGAIGAGNANFANIQAKEMLSYSAAHDDNQINAVFAYLNMVNQL